MPHPNSQSVFVLSWMIRVFHNSSGVLPKVNFNLIKRFIVNTILFAFDVAQFCMIVWVHLYFVVMLLSLEAMLLPFNVYLTIMFCVVPVFGLHHPLCCSFNWIVSYSSNLWKREHLCCMYVCVCVCVCMHMLCVYNVQVSWSDNC